MIFNTFYFFSSDLITTTVANDACKRNYNPEKFGLVIFSKNDPSTHSIFAKFNSFEYGIGVTMLVSSYISQVFRIGVSQLPTKNTLEFKLTFFVWGLTIFAGQILNFQNVYVAMPYIVQYSDELQSECVKADVSFMIHFPYVILCLTTFEMLLFLCYHVKIDPKTFKVSIVFKETIVIEFNKTRNKENLLLDKVEEITEINAEDA
ncbi:hypothetical protein RF11_05151 [Thelohanellus kitauei]|uniref:Uncharacterized protein n=1 Tax=Thelohanellus kitauei TaxID=669202 RepID=A0A0C2MT40_THEKT|nr:hypothetical protein RF11_05151 [Thelohanellus kitauei]